MKHKRILLTIVLSLCLIAGVVGFTACNNDKGNNGANSVNLTADMSQEELLNAVKNAEGLTYQFIRQERRTLENGDIQNGHFVLTGMCNSGFALKRSNVTYDYELVNGGKVNDDRACEIDYTDFTGDIVYEYDYEYRFYSYKEGMNQPETESEITKTQKKYFDNKETAEIFETVSHIIGQLQKTDSGWKGSEGSATAVTFENGAVCLKNAEDEPNGDYIRDEYSVSKINSTTIAKPEEMANLNESDAFWSGSVKYNGFEYCLNNEKTAYKADTNYSYDNEKAKITSLTIEAEINTLPVNEIGFGAFSGYHALKILVIPKSVTTISGNAIYNFNELNVYCEVESKPAGWASNWNDGSCKVYWFSETEPTTPGNYWHYADGVPTVWDTCVKIPISFSDFVSAVNEMNLTFSATGASENTSAEVLVKIDNNDIFMIQTAQLEDVIFRGEMYLSKKNDKHYIYQNIDGQGEFGSVTDDSEAISVLSSAELIESNYTQNGSVYTLKDEYKSDSYIQNKLSIDIIITEIDLSDSADIVIKFGTVNIDEETNVRSWDGTTVTGYITNLGTTTIELPQEFLDYIAAN